MPFPIAALALVALPFMGDKMKQADPALLIVGGLALLWMGQRTAETLGNAAATLGNVRDKANIVPETGEFLGGLFRGAETDYTYAPAQSGSPNPPTQGWWEMASDLGATDDWEDRGAGPIRVADGIAVPTSPIIIADLPSTAEKFGANVRNFFTSGALLRAIDPAEYIQ